MLFLLNALIRYQQSRRLFFYVLKIGFDFMLLIPAIDLKEGKCVRLRQGRMEDDTVFSDNPVEVAARWVNEGAQRIH